MITVWAALGLVGGLLIAALLVLGWFLIAEIRAQRAMAHALNETVKQAIGILGQGSLGEALRWLPQIAQTTRELAQQNALLTGALEDANAEHAPAPPVPSAVVEEVVTENRRVRRAEREPVPLSEAVEEATVAAREAEGSEQPTY